MTKPRSNTFTDFLPLLADHDDRLSGKARRPFRDIGMTPPHRARNEVGISFEVFVGPDVNENGARRRADQV